MKARLVYGVTALLAAASVARGDGVQRASQAIVQGAPSRDAAVVALLGPDGSLLCSGTLIRPQVVLTAAHCMQAKEELPASVSEDASLPAAKRVQVTRWLRHPDYVPDTLQADVGLVGLAQALSAEPLELADGYPAPGLPNLPVRVVGYGCIELESEVGAGQRRTRDDVVEAQSEDHKLRHGGTTCRGDSGGPLLARFPDTSERVVGISSSGGARNGTAFSLAMAAGDYAGWLVPQADLMQQELAPDAAERSDGCSLAVRASLPQTGPCVPEVGWLVCTAFALVARRRRARLCLCGCRRAAADHGRASR